jgi:hypothetical protein
MLSDQDSGNPFGGQTPFVKIRSLKAQSKALIPRINDTTHDAPPLCKQNFLGC